MTTHVSSACRAGFFQLHQLQSVRRSLTTEATRALVQTFISCHLDYCNSVLARVPDVYLQQLQSVQVSGARRHDHITPVFVSLQWLPGDINLWTTHLFQGPCKFTSVVSVFNVHSRKDTSTLFQKYEKYSTA